MVNPVEINLDSNQSNYQIRAYEPGILTINQETYQQSLLLTPDKLVPNWPVSSIDELQTAHIEQLLSISADIILLGTGERLQFPPQALLAPLYKKQLGMEIMDTAAACRTFTVLASEGRQVLAALILEKP